MSHSYAPMPDQGTPIRSRVAPDINPANGGIVDDSQAADTSPGSGPSYAGGNLKEKVEGRVELLAGKMLHNEHKIEEGRAKLEHAHIADAQQADDPTMRP